MSSDRIIREVLPPTNLQDQGSWKVLKFWNEELPGGGKLPTICDACGAIYLGKWEKVTLKDGGSRVRPVMEGGIIWPQGRQDGLACHCRAGEKWAGMMPLATKTQVDAERNRRARLVEVGRKMLGEGVEDVVKRMAERARQAARMDQKPPKESSDQVEADQLKMAKWMNELQGTDRWLECRQVLMNLKPEMVADVEETYAAVLEGKKPPEAFITTLNHAEETALAISKGRSHD